MTTEPGRPVGAEAQLADEAADPLNRLAGRGELTAWLEQRLGDSAPHRRTVAAVVINLDDFRSVNTLHGAATGDQVLRVVAERLLSGTRSRSLPEESAERGPDLIAHLGADEFAILCGPPAPSIAETEALAARLLHSLEIPIAIGGNVMRLTARAGVLVATTSHHGPDDLLRSLDLAVEQAKAMGPGAIVAWRPELDAAATQRSSLAAQLRRAFDNGEFVLHYQPVLRLADGGLVGAEGLLRWNNPSEGLVNCAAFVPALEESGLIVELGNWVLRETVRQVERWDALYGRDIVEWVGVNLSPRQLHHPERLLATLRAIDAGGFSLHRLCLEIPAAALGREPDSGGVLAELRGLGPRIAIDDFGTGHVWPQSLDRQLADTVKIDGEFTARVGTPDGERLMHALLAIARLHAADIIAEGIETPAQRDFLRQTGCGFGQGYLFAEPMDGALFGTYSLTHAVANGAGGRRAG